MSTAMAAHAVRGVGATVLVFIGHRRTDWASTSLVMVDWAAASQGVYGDGAFLFITPRF
jgi:hypothetical protein